MLLLLAGHNPSSLKTQVAATVLQFYHPKLSEASKVLITDVYSPIEPFERFEASEGSKEDG